MLWQKKKKIPPPACVSKIDTTKKVSLFYGFTTHLANHSNPAWGKKKKSLKESIMAMDLSKLRGNLNLHVVPFLTKTEFLCRNMQWWQSQASLLFETSFFYPACILAVQKPHFGSEHHSGCKHGPCFGEATCHRFTELLSSRGRQRLARERRAGCDPPCIGFLTSRISLVRW